MEVDKIFNEVSILINFFLLMVTFGTVLFAKRNLQAIDSPRLVVTNIKDKLTREDGEQHFIRVSVKNFGNGIALRTYLIVITKNKKYHLSKPIVTMEKNNSGELEVEIGLRNEVEKALVVTQDFFNTYYIVNVNTKFNNSHLHTMVRPVKRIANYGLARLRINLWMKKAKKQGNTYPDLIERQQRKEIQALKSKFENTVFVEVNKEGK